MTGGGLKKCMPTTRSGPGTPAASAVTLSEEVLVASTQSPATCPATSANRSPLELEVLGRGLDHQPGVRERRERVRRPRASRASSRSQAALLDPALDPAARALQPALERLGVGVVQQAARARPARRAAAIPAPIVPAPSTPMTFGAAAHRCEYYGIDPFTVIFGGTLLFFVVFVLLLGLFSKRSAIDILDWKPTRSPELEAQNDIDDVQQMIDAQNEIRRRRGLPERDEDEIEESVRRHREELARAGAPLPDPRTTDVARVLIVPCGCRGRALAAELVAAGHAVRGTTRAQASAEAIRAAGAEPYLGDPDRIGTLMDALVGRDDRLLADGHDPGARAARGPAADAVGEARRHARARRGLRRRRCPQGEQVARTASRDLADPARGARRRPARPRRLAGARRAARSTASLRRLDRASRSCRIRPVAPQIRWPSTS